MRTFTPPHIDTRQVGVIGFQYAFQLRARYEPAHQMKTTRGGRYYQSITGGEVSGPKLRGAVYPGSGGDYDAIQCRTGVRDLNAHFMIKADTGEWIYFEHHGYCRPDGYYRIQAYFDADRYGKYDWLNHASVIATARESSDRLSTEFTYFEVV